jgi:zinc transport system substrate-binding protein
MMKAFSFCLSILLIFSLIILSCQKKEGNTIGQKKIGVITTLFPLYDFAKKIGQEKADIRLLLPPGVEAHAFEPRPADMSRIQKADLFIYTGPFMEPWVGKLLQGIDTKKVAVVDTSQGITLTIRHHEQDEAPKTDDHYRHEAEYTGEYRAGGFDPHIWLDFSIAIKMVETIAAGFINKDPQNQNFYRSNADKYKHELEDLDRKYKTVLSSCNNRIIIHAGHFAFGYLAKRYDLKYVSAYKGFAPDAEPTPKRLVELIKKLEQYDLNTIYYEELITPKVADTISKETGCNMLMIHGAHNVTKEDMDRGVAFIPLMEKNLENLRLGMKCR